MVLGETVHLNCSAVGDTNGTTYEWVQLGVAGVLLNTDPSVGELEITLTATAQYGEYRCTVFGSNGTNASGTLEIVQASKLLLLRVCVRVTYLLVCGASFDRKIRKTHDGFGTRTPDTRLLVRCSYH